MEWVLIVVVGRMFRLVEEWVLLLSGPIAAGVALAVRVQERGSGSMPAWLGRAH